MLKRAAQRSLRRPIGCCRRLPFLPDELGAVHPPDRPLEMPEISTDGKVYNGEGCATKTGVRDVKLISLLLIRPTGH